MPSLEARQGCPDDVVVRRGSAEEQEGADHEGVPSAMTIAQVGGVAQ